MSLTWWNWERGVLSGLMPFGQEIASGLRVPPKWEAISLVCWNGVSPAQAQPAWYMLSILRAAERLQPAEPFERLELLLDRVGNLVLGEQLADGAVLALGARAVVAPDVEDDGVVAKAERVELVDDPADLGVGVLDEAGEDLHQPPLEGPLGLGDAVPGGHGLGARRELGVGGDPAELLLALEDALAHRVPAVVELALVLVGPLLGDVVRPVAGAGRPVHEEGLVGREGAVLAQPGERLVRQVLAQVVLLVVRRLDRIGVLEQARLPLRGLAGEEAVEVVEAVCRWASG